MPKDRHFDWTLRDGSVRRLCLTARARATAEERMGQAVCDYLAFDSRSDRKAALTLQAALEAGRKRGGEGPVTLDQAFELIDGEGLAAVVRAIGSAFQCANEDPDARPAEATPSGN